MDPVDEIARWRVRVFSTLLPIVLGLGTIAAIPSIGLMLYRGKWQVAVMDVIALAWIFAIWRWERMRYTPRVLHFLAVLFLIAVGLMLAVGPVGLNYLMAPPLMAVILLGTGPGIACLALSALFIVAVGASGSGALYVHGLDGTPFITSVVIAINFTCVGALVTLTAGTLLKGLSHTLREARTAAASLETGQERLRAVNAELRLTSEAVARLNDMVLIARMVDTPGAEQPIIFANDAFLRHTGYRREEIVGSSVRMLQGPETDRATVARIVHAVRRKEAVSAELVNYTRAGAPFWMQLEMVPFAGETGSITHWVMVGRDVTERRNSAAAIHRLAFYDVLTGLPNRRLLMDRLGQLAAAAQAGPARGAVLYVDLDDFKTINDARGHAIGDLLLREAATRLESIVAGAGIVARLGGDEFVVLLDDVGETHAATAIAERIRSALAERMDIEGQRHYASASVGVALAAGGAQSVHDLLREADTAMYHAKGQGRNGVALFEPGMLVEAERKLTLERDLAHALEHGELALHLQLQLDHEGSPRGAEMLLRWRRKDGSSVPPDVFIPVAEASGLIVALGEWVLRQACLAWHTLAAAGHALPLSVNVSPVQFRQPDFVARVAAILEETGAPAGQLILEVTEGVMVERMEETIARMGELAALGLRISVDDFGTGYSSLAYLTRMPLYELKIDKSFIRNTPHDQDATAIVQSILAMAGHLGLRVVAEGVETPDQAQYLAAHSNACMQGYLFHRPMPLDSVLALFAHLPAVAPDVRLAAAALLPQEPAPA
ncbi:bifunctional diguanylate cyclase/phosphodiesterase [Massilia sp. YIM B02443]|uniref:putative bifunctional diguanylate cyclase/phosphodiesterase n=1 Tax=Massilia sp. YIM B02443 TaxID=3050127 RepID=UPI0025B6788C|nr:GGDEF domain-containing phosphodiesterase [Massilia sp. YIM B02443]MDN4039590.1 EAL domain-containing protein [Massilia sp. YIM B02443]